MGKFDDGSTVSTGASSADRGLDDDTALFQSFRPLEEVPASEIFRAKGKSISGWAALPKTSQALIIAASFLLLAAGVGVALWYWLSRKVASTWAAVLVGESAGNPVHYAYPCNSTACTFDFDSGNPVEIKFNGTENLTDSKGHALQTPWVWSSDRDVEMRVLPAGFNESLRVNNDSSRSFQVVAHQRTPASHPHPAPSKPTPSAHPSPSPSKPPSPAPLVPPPYCEVYLDGRLFVVYLNSTLMMQSNLAMNASKVHRCGTDMTPSPLGVFSPYQSEMQVYCYEGATYSIDGVKPIVNGSLKPAYELINFSFWSGEDASPFNFSYAFCNRTFAMATVVLGVAYKGQLSQEAVAAGPQNLHVKDYWNLIPNSTLSVSGAAPDAMVNCYRNSRVFSSGRNLAVRVLGDSDQFDCIVTTPYLNPLSLSFQSSGYFPQGTYLPIKGAACSVFRDNLLVGALASANMAPAPYPMANPSVLYVLPDSDIDIECSPGVSCRVVPSPSLMVSDTDDYYNRLPEESFNYSVGKDPLSLFCTGSFYPDINFNVVPYARVAGFYWYVGVLSDYSQQKNFSSIIYDGDDGQKEVIQVVENTQAGAKLVGDAYSMCSQDDEKFFHGNPIMFNASRKGVVTKCQVMSPTDFVSASLWFESIAEPNSTSASASQIGIFSNKNKVGATLADVFANAVAP